MANPHTTRLLLGVVYIGASDISVVKRIPEDDETDVDPDVTISMSVRSEALGILTLSVYLDDVLYVTRDGLEDGVEGTFIPNAFNGWDLSFEHADFSYDSLHTIRVVATDGDSSEFEAEWSFSVRQDLYCENRFAIPAKMREKDPTTVKWLKIWDGVCRFVKDRTIAKINQRQLFDIDQMGEDEMREAFQSVGLIFPDFPEIDTERKRRILKHADDIHASRYSKSGLEYYISLLVDATVEITGFYAGFIILFNTSAFNFPNAYMMSTSQQEEDICTYLVGARDITITITITGVVPEAVKEFIRDTIPYEIPMADDPINPTPIDIIFVEP